MGRRTSGTGTGNRRRVSGGAAAGNSGQFKATATMSGTGHVHQFGSGQMTATAALSSTGGMVGKLGTGALTGTAALTGTGSVVSTTYSLFYPSTSGPSSGVSYGGNFLSGVIFKVTASGHTLNAYAWWVQAGTNPNPTAAQKFCLYTNVSSVWSLVPLTTVTSGTLHAGWNVISLGTPVALVSGQVYQAATGFTGNFNDTNNQFGNGQPFQAGITNGPLFGYADQGAPGQAPFTFAQMAFSTAGNDPTVNQPTTDDAASNFWIDVVVA